MCCLCLQTLLNIILIIEVSVGLRPGFIIGISLGDILVIDKKKKKN